MKCNKLAHDVRVHCWQVPGGRSAEQRVGVEEKQRRVAKEESDTSLTPSDLKNRWAGVHCVILMSWLR